MHFLRVCVCVYVRESVPDVRIDLVTYCLVEKKDMTFQLTKRHFSLQNKKNIPTDPLINVE